MSVFTDIATEYKKPQSLKKGDKIGIVAPARPASQGDLQVIKRLLESRGFRCYEAENVTRRHGYLAGEDDKRAAAFMAMWQDPTIKAIWCVGGGYGSMRLLDKLDYSVFSRSPKIFIGMSDITALHAALGKEASLVTFLGPNLLKWSKDSELGIEQADIWDQLLNLVTGNEVSLLNDQKGFTIRGGQASGRLVGGNLALISAMVGSSWQLETEEKVLLLEDVNEEPYRVDRMLRQLLYAGMLESPAAVVLASWKNCDASRPHESLSLENIFKEYFENVPYPVFVGFPSGHIDRQLTLPLNCMVRVDSDAQNVIILEDAVEINRIH